MKRKYDPYHIGYCLGIICIAIYYLYVLANQGFRSSRPLLIIFLIMEAPVVFFYLQRKKTK